MASTGSPRLSELTSASWITHWTRQKRQNLESGPRTNENGFLLWRSFKFSWSLPGLFRSACSLDALYLSALSLPGNVFLHIVDPGKRLTSSSVLRVDPLDRKFLSRSPLNAPWVQTIFPYLCISCCIFNTLVYVSTSQAAWEVPWMWKLLLSSGCFLTHPDPGEEADLEIT